MFWFVYLRRASAFPHLIALKDLELDQPDLGATLRHEHQSHHLGRHICPCDIRDAVGHRRILGARRHVRPRPTARLVLHVVAHRHRKGPTDRRVRPVRVRVRAGLVALVEGDLGAADARARAKVDRIPLARRPVAARAVVPVDDVGPEPHAPVDGVVELLGVGVGDARAAHGIRRVGLPLDGLGEGPADGGRGGGGGAQGGDEAGQRRRGVGLHAVDLHDEALRAKVAAVDVPLHGDVVAVVEDAVGAEPGHAAVDKRVHLEVAVGAGPDPHQPPEDEVGEARVEVVRAARERDERAAVVGVVVLDDVELARGGVVVQLGVGAQERDVVGGGDDGLRGVVVEQVGQPAEDRGGLEGPHGAVPLALLEPGGAVVPVLAHVVLVAGLDGAEEAGGGEQVVGGGGVGPGLRVRVVVGRHDVPRPGGEADELAAADEIPVGDVRVGLVVAVDEVLEGAVPQAGGEVALEGVGAGFVRGRRGGVARGGGELGDGPRVGVHVAVDAGAEGLAPSEAVGATRGVYGGDGVLGGVVEGLDPVEALGGIIVVFPLVIDGGHGGEVRGEGGEVTIDEVHAPGSVGNGLTEMPVVPIGGGLGVVGVPAGLSV